MTICRPLLHISIECSLTGQCYPADTLQTLFKAGRPLLVRYDLDGVCHALSREELAGRPQTLWRYQMLPVRRPEKLGEHLPHADDPGSAAGRASRP